MLLAVVSPFRIAFVVGTKVVEKIVPVVEPTVDRMGSSIVSVLMIKLMCVETIVAAAEIPAMIAAETATVAAPVPVTAIVSQRGWCRHGGADHK